MAEGSLAKTNPERSNFDLRLQFYCCIIQKVDEFLEAIRVKRFQDPERPLVLIGHSLGGLLIEQALVNAHNNPKYTHIKDATTQRRESQTVDIRERYFEDRQGRQIADVSCPFKIVSDKSANFGTLPEDVENVVKLTGGHSDICKSDPANETDADNLEIAACNIQELYDIALRESELAKSKLRMKLQGAQSIPGAAKAHGFRYSVVSPHEDTFDWIFDGNQDSGPLSNHLSSMLLKGDENENFREWFRKNSFEEWMRSKTSDDGIEGNGNKKNVYWIVGRAGSGKLTLMKHIFQHPRTDQSLSLWTETSQLLKAGYFFEREHSSEKHLLQTLLHQILSHDESIIHKVYKELWEQFARFRDIREKRPGRHASTGSHSEFIGFEKMGIDSNILGVDDLFGALMRAVELISATTKLFFLTDGLDEIVGVCDDLDEDQRTAYEMCQSLSQRITEIAKNKDIKICVSSRPHLGFEDEEGTKGLSEAFFGGSDRARDHALRIDPQPAKEICRDIKDKASGMFLWVSIVVKLLIDGVNNRNRLPELKGKVQTLPKELTRENGLYMQMLKGVGRGQLAERARIITILLRSFLMQIALSPLLLDFAEEEGGIEDLIDERQLGKFDAKNSLQRVKDRLKSCCGGLFEVRKINPTSQTGSEQGFYNDSIVDAVHGTVWEFLIEQVAIEGIANIHPWSLCLVL
ncbi:uncharacterized protein PAC_08178 [Phialocephala subalpina]|uniref:Nephrocystin 3-like N-terminal domain-containing protein n=1 Tax=Phialocephala subalpina TaxID=576137 RepID=A0A1L7WZV4_9HELO|nr:uncharacterized protein PAC_08178 [Phialocephala subalpina]